MRIVHFSDIHANGWIENVRGYFDKRLLGAFNYLLRRKRFHDWRLVTLGVDKILQLQPDIVVCTGDLTSIGEPGEFERATAALRPLVEATGFELIYVPGNHDYYVAAPSCRDALACAFRFVNRDRWRLTDLPVEFTVGNLSLLLVNEAVPAPLYASTGRIDERTQRFIQDFFARPSTDRRGVVLIGHYPLFDKNGRELSRQRRCFNNQSLQKAFLNGQIGVSLCGHIHDQFCRRHGKSSLEICAGSLSYNGMVNIVDYDPASGQFVQSWVNVRE